MKRRKFIKGLAIAPAVLAAGPLLVLAPENNFDNFMNDVLNQVRKNSGIPEEIFDMEFSQEYSLSKYAGYHGLVKLPNENDSEFRNRIIEIMKS